MNTLLYNFLKFKKLFCYFSLLTVFIIIITIRMLRLTGCDRLFSFPISIGTLFFFCIFFRTCVLNLCKKKKDLVVVTVTLCSLILTLVQLTRSRDLCDSSACCSVLQWELAPVHSFKTSGIEQTSSQKKHGQHQRLNGIAFCALLHISTTLFVQFSTIGMCIFRVPHTWNIMFETPGKISYIC